VRAAFDLAAAQGWDHVHLRDIAAACGCSLSDIRKIFQGKGDILAACFDYVDGAVARRVSVSRDSPERDRLFDVLMERFDILGEEREAVLSILRALRGDPKQAFGGVPHLGRSMAAMLDAAGISAAGPCGVIRVFGLSAVYLYALKVWTEDESADLSKTMAALDTALARAEKAMGMIAGIIPA
jgi:AcrR family transcriptional regulator